MFEKIFQNTKKTGGVNALENMVQWSQLVISGFMVKINLSAEILSELNILREFIEEKMCTIESCKEAEALIDFQIKRSCQDNNSEKPIRYEYFQI